MRGIKAPVCKYNLVLRPVTQQLNLVAFLKVSVGDPRREAGWEGSAGEGGVATRPLSCLSLTGFCFAAALESSPFSSPKTPSSPDLPPFTVLVCGPQSIILWLHWQRADVIVPCHKLPSP